MDAELVPDLMMCDVQKVTSTNADMASPSFAHSLRFQNVNPYLRAARSTWSHGPHEIWTTAVFGEVVVTQ